MAFLNNAGLERLWEKITAKLNAKVDKVDGKGLSTNDYTTAEKNKLAGIATGATKVTVDSALSSSSTNPVQNKVVNTEISGLKSLVGDTAVSTQITNAVAGKVDKVDGKGLSTNDYTTTEKNKLSGIASGAEVNQNAFSNIYVGSTTIAADSKTDTLILAAGTNITLTPDETNDKVTISLDRAIYAQNDEPANAPEGAMWIDLGDGATGVSMNADTLDGNHASYFATASDLADLQTLVGDTSVTSQISEALTNFSSGKTLTEHFAEEQIVLTPLQYGDKLPTAGTQGRLFFKRVSS